MTDGEPGPDTTVLPRRAGEQLRDARVAQGLDLGDIAARTRIPQRHLESIEAGSYADLPSVTYAIGFARAYARAVGIDEVALAAVVRGELGNHEPRQARAIPAYQVEDPSRQPSRGVAIGGVIVAALLLIGIALWYGTDLFRGGTTAPATSETVAVPIPETVAAAPTPTPGAGPVVITATDEVWVHVSDAAGQTLLMKTMAPGERFDVPADANDPRIEAGRPDKLAITVGGTAVAPLGDGRVAIKGVSLSPASLLARGGDATPSATPTPAVQPSGRPTTAPPTTSAARPTPRPSPTPTATPTTRPFEPAFGNGTSVQ